MYSSVCDWLSKDRYRCGSEYSPLVTHNFKWDYYNTFFSLNTLPQKVLNYTLYYYNIFYIFVKSLFMVGAREMSQRGFMRRDGKNRSLGGVVSDAALDTHPTKDINNSIEIKYMRTLIIFPPHL
jgi:hypothetical protein